MAASTDIIWSPKYEPVQTRNSYKSGDTNYFTKCGYICCIHCVGETAENVIKTLPTSLRPIYEVSLSGWCENESNGTYYSCIARLKKDGTWGYVSAFTAFSGDNLYYIYNQSGTNRLKNFLLWLSGAWATSYNGY